MGSFAPLPLLASLCSRGHMPCLPRHLTRLSFPTVAVLLAASLSGCLGCAGDEAPDSAEPSAAASRPEAAGETLRHRFPSQAALVLQTGRRFVATGAGFAPEATD